MKLMFFCRRNYKKLPGKTSKRTISIISKKKNNNLNYFYIIANLTIAVREAKK